MSSSSSSSTPPAGSERSELAKGALINSLGFIVRSAKGIYLILLPRLFGVEIFGLYLLTWAIVEVIGKLASIGLEWGLLRLVVHLSVENRQDEIRGTVYRALALGFFTSCIVAGLLSLFSSFVALTLLKKEELVWPLTLFACALPLLSLLYMLLFAIRASKKMQYEVYVRSLIEPAILLLGGVSVYFIRPGIEGIIIAHLISLLVGAVVALVFFHRLFPKPSSDTKTHMEWRFLIHYSLPMSGMDFLNTLKTKLDVMIIARFLTLSDVGIFGAIVEIGNILKKVRQAFEPIFMPIVSQLHKMKELVRLQLHFARTLRWIMIVGFAILGPLALTPELFLGLFGQEFISGSIPLVIFCLGIFVFMTLGMSDYFLSMTGHPYLNFFNSALLLVLTFGLHLLLIPPYGLIGAAIASATAISLFSILGVIEIWLCERIHPFSAAQGKSLSAALLAFAGCLAMDYLWQVSALLLLLSFFSLYIGALRLLGRQPEDQEIVDRVRARFQNLFRKGKDFS